MANTESQPRFLDNPLNAYKLSVGVIILWMLIYVSYQLGRDNNLNEMFVLTVPSCTESDCQSIGKQQGVASAVVFDVLTYEIHVDETLLTRVMRSDKIAQFKKGIEQRTAPRRQLLASQKLNLVKDIQSLAERANGSDFQIYLSTRLSQDDKAAKLSLDVNQVKTLIEEQRIGQKTDLSRNSM